ncbi:hypothetical protein CMK12_15455 [Candidatus Poribacteria bacterium]|jgi:iron(II)-dependent oxidoreductase|nr:hypothetical protein [Candidatus Poribacteria bacterium]MDP6999001.1 SUMF1/EgtB/PvdO family nonheme iron enzyme [Candidatus Poribacteria bacterium]
MSWKRLSQSVSTCALIACILIGCVVIIFGCQETTNSTADRKSILLTYQSEAEIPTQEIVHLADQSIMILIPEGKFVMGRDGDSSEHGESPAHVVYLNSFYIDKFEVTNARYQHFIDQTGAVAPDFWGDMNGPDLPVSWLTWYQAETYCQWVSKRLPTEAEWEKAARGDDQRLYPWGDWFDWRYGNFSDDYLEDGHLDGFAGAAPIGSFPQDVSPYGVHDMGGNVLEWVADWQDLNYYSVSPERNPTGPPTGMYKIVRGGAMDIGPQYSRTVFRNRLVPHLTNMTFGFR